MMKCHDCPRSTNRKSRFAGRIPHGVSQGITTNDLLDLLLEGLMVVRTWHRPAVAPIAQTTSECSGDTISLIRATVCRPGPRDLMHRIIRGLATQTSNGSQARAPKDNRRRHCYCNNEKTFKVCLNFRRLLVRNYIIIFAIASITGMLHLRTDTYIILVQRNVGGIESWFMKSSGMFESCSNESERLRRVSISIPLWRHPESRRKPLFHIKILRRILFPPNNLWAPRFEPRMWWICLDKHSKIENYSRMIPLSSSSFPLCGYVHFPPWLLSPNS